MISTGKKGGEYDSTFFLSFLGKTGQRLRPTSSQSIYVLWVMQLDLLNWSVGAGCKDSFGFGFTNSGSRFRILGFGLIQRVERF